MNFYVDYNNERERALHHVTKFSKINLKEHSFCIQVTRPNNIFLTNHCTKHEIANYSLTNDMVFGDIKLHKKKFKLTEYENFFNNLKITKKFMLHITNSPFTMQTYTSILDQSFIFPIIKMIMDRTDELYLELHNKTIYPGQEKKFVSKLKKQQNFWLQYLNINPKIQYFSIATEQANDKLKWHMCKPLYQDNILTNFK